MSEKEIKIQKSQVIKFFDELSKEEDFLAKSLPIANKTESIDGTANRAYEIDLSSRTKLEKRMGIGKLDCFPVLVVFSFTSKTEWTVKLK